MGLPIGFADCRNYLCSEEEASEQTRQRVFRATAVPGFVDSIFHFRLDQFHAVTRLFRAHAYALVPKRRKRKNVANVLQLKHHEQR